MAMVWDPEGTEGGYVYLYQGSYGSAEKDSVVVGDYNGGSAEIVRSHATIVKIGPVMVDYDPYLNSLFGDYF